MNRFIISIIGSIDIITSDSSLLFSSYSFLAFSKSTLLKVNFLTSIQVSLKKSNIFLESPSNVVTCSKNKEYDKNYSNL